MYILLFFVTMIHILLNSDNLLLLFAACDPGKLDITVPKLATVYIYQPCDHITGVCPPGGCTRGYTSSTVQVCDTHNLFKHAHTLIFDKQVKYVDR